jgi:hypothetical protein
LQSWLKFYETITKPLPIASTLFLFVSTLFLLSASDSTLAKLGLSFVIKNYRTAVGLGFIIALIWLAVTAFLWILKSIRRALLATVDTRQEKIRIENAIPQLNPKEREIIGCLLGTNQRMFTNTPDGGYANTLVSKKIVVLALRPGQTFPYWETPFEVPEHVWKILLEHKAKFPYVATKDGEEPHPWRIH